MTRTSRIAVLVACGAAFIAALLVLILRPARPHASAPESAPRAQTPDAPSTALVDGGDVETESAPIDASAVRAPAFPSKAPSPIEATGLTVEVRGPDGEPAAGVTVALAREAERAVLAHATTGADGTVSFGVFDPPIDLYVVSHTVLCRKERLDAVRDRYVVHLNDTSVLRGAVLIDGAETNEILRFGIATRFDAQSMQAAPAFLCDALMSFVPAEDHPIVGLRLPCTTDERGRFAVYGLRPNWQGTLGFGGPYVMETGERELAIEDVRTPVLLRLRTPAAITGRVVSGETREPVVGARGMCMLECADSSGRSPLEFVGDGRFRIPLRCRGEIHARISLGTANGRRVLDLPDVPADGLDLGDILLEAAHEVWVDVHDASGEPIVGATVSVADDTAVENATGGNGRVVLRGVLPTSSELVVSAPGYVGRKCVFQPASATEQHPFDVVLQAESALEVEVHVREGQNTRDLVLEVVSWDLQPFATIDGEIGRDVALRLDWDNVQGTRSHSGGQRESARDGTVWMLRAKLSSEGHLRVNGFMPRQRAVVRLLDSAGVFLDEREIVPTMLTRGEAIVFTLDAEPSTLILDIADAQDEPLAAATVVGWSADAALDPNNPPLATSDQDGRAVIERVYARTVDLQVRRNGFAPIALHGIAIDAPIVRRRVILEQGLEVDVCAFDSRGQPVSIETVAARLDGRSISHGLSSGDEGCRRLHDLPADSIELVASLGGRTFRNTHDARVSTARIEVPEPGSMRVVLPARSESPSLRRLRIRDESDPTVVVDRYISAKQSDEFVDVPVLFPGSYTVELSEIDATSGKAERVVARAEHVIVSANERATVRLTKPWAPRIRVHSVDSIAVDPYAARSPTRSSKSWPRKRPSRTRTRS